jgi:hypothetical protein
MEFEFDTVKRNKTLLERGLDTARRGSPHHQHEESK